MSSTPSYDVIVVGGGPAGLSAARASARLGFSTLVLERLAAPGELDHPCSAIVTPVPRSFLNGSSERLYFRKIDLAIPGSLVLGAPSEQRWLGLDGSDARLPLGPRRNAPAVMIDKPGLLRLLAREAEAAGAELRFGTEVIETLRAGSRITGVRTAGGKVRGQLILAAEGVNRSLSRQVLPALRTRGKLRERHGFVASQELEAPAAGEEHVGQFITLGRRYSSAREGFGMSVVPAPGRLAVYFTLFADGPNHYSERSAQYYLKEYMHEDPRLRPLCAGARPIRSIVARTTLADAPASVVADGFVGAGDAVAPGGYLGILPAIYLGRRAALAAADALDAGDTSARRLAAYDALYRERFLPDLEAEARLLSHLCQLPDEEVDAFCEGIEGRTQPLPFSAHAHALHLAAVGSLNGRPRTVRPQWDVWSPSALHVAAGPVWA